MGRTDSDRAREKYAIAIGKGEREKRRRDQERITSKWEIGLVIEAAKGSIRPRRFEKSGHKASFTGSERVFS